MIIAIVGGRDFQDKALLEATMEPFIEHTTGFVSGGAKGADTLGENWAIAHGLPRTVHIPNWYPNGRQADMDRAAGHKRNRLIVNDADIVIAFWDGNSTGTKGSIDLAKSMGKELHVVYYKPTPIPVLTPVVNEHHQYFRTTGDGKRILQCHSKGAKEYSPFFCLVEAFGDTRSIEDHYQSMKVFEGPEGQIAKAKYWKDAKTMQHLGIERLRFELPNGLDLGNYNDKVSDLPIQYYIALWYKFLRRNPRLVENAREYDGFEDIFEGNFPFSQAKVIEQCVKGGISSLRPMFADIHKLLNEKGSQ